MADIKKISQALNDWLKSEYNEYKGLETERKNKEDPKYKENTQEIWVKELGKIPFIHRQQAFSLNLST